MSFTVQIAKSGHSFTVEDGETIIDAALRQNIGLPYGCRNGVCGSCEAKLISGEVSYPDDQPKPSTEGRCLPCQGMPASDLVLDVREVEKAAEIEVKLLPTRVAHVEHMAHDVIRIHLKLPDNQRMQFLAGQYLDFVLSDGRHRSFSIANAPHDDEFIELHIRHVDGGAFTDWAFSKMQEKSILRIEAPLGTFTLDEGSDRPMIFVGGGTGFAPLKGQIEHAFHEGVERPMYLYWGVRSRRDLYLPDLPEQWVKDHPNFKYVPVLSEPDNDWDGRSGWVHEAVVADHVELSGFDVYMAGPPPMIIAARDAFGAAGLSAEHMFYDSFDYATDGKPKD